MPPITIHSSHVHDPMRGIALKLVSVMFFGLMALCVKLLDGTYPTSEIVFARSLFALLPLLPLLWLAGRQVLHTRRPLGHLLRGLIGLTAMFTTFYVIPKLPLATFTTISFTMPLFVAVLAAFVLREHLNRHKLAAVLIGFAGILLVLRPGAGLADPASLLALLTAFLVAIIAILIRQLTATENSLSIVLWFTLLCTLLSGSVALFEYIPPSVHDGLLMAGSGLFGGLGQVLLTQSYRYGQVSILTALEYTGLLWAVLFDYLFWREVPDFMTLLGASVIIGSGLYILHQARTTQSPAPPPHTTPHTPSSGQSKTC